MTQEGFKRKLAAIFSADVEGYSRLMDDKVKNPDVFIKYLQGLSLLRKDTKESLMRYGQMSQEIIDTDPESPLGYRMLGGIAGVLQPEVIHPRRILKRPLRLAKRRSPWMNLMRIHTPFWAISFY